MDPLGCLLLQHDPGTAPMRHEAPSAGREGVVPSVPVERDISVGLVRFDRR
jgi:hypothetical protein